MCLYQSKISEFGAVTAIKWDGENEDQVFDLARRAKVTCCTFFEGAGEQYASDDSILIADLEFPFWLRLGEWLTFDGVELDAWPDPHFRETFTCEVPATVEG